MRAIFFMALLAVAASAQASDNASAETATAPTLVVVAPGDKMICRREQVSGSNIPGKRICRLKSDLDAERAAALESAKEMVTPQGGSSSSN